MQFAFSACPVLSQRSHLTQNDKNNNQIKFFHNKNIIKRINTTIHSFYNVITYQSSDHVFISSQIILIIFLAIQLIQRQAVRRCSTRIQRWRIYYILWGTALFCNNKDWNKTVIRPKHRKSLFIFKIHHINKLLKVILSTLGFRIQG